MIKRAHVYSWSITASYKGCELDSDQISALIHKAVREELTSEQLERHRGSNIGVENLDISEVMRLEETDPTIDEDEESQDPDTEARDVEDSVGSTVGGRSSRGRSRSLAATDGTPGPGTITIDDEEVPLAQQLVAIEDEEVPLAGPLSPNSTPMTGDTRGVHLAVLLCMVAAAVSAVTGSKKHSRK